MFTKIFTFSKSKLKRKQIGFKCLRESLRAGFLPADYLAAKKKALRHIRQQCKIDTMKISFKTDSSEQTEKFGEALSRYLEAGTVITLDGDLGAGKTCLTRGIARGLAYAVSFRYIQTFRRG